MPQDTVKSGTNNFQGRYAILHPWTGAIACESPQHGVWGGPPGQQIADPMAAQNLAFAPRGGVELSSLVAQDVPAIDVLASQPQKLPDPIRKPQGCTCDAGGGAATGSGVLLGGIVALIMRRRRRA
jgi:MYXO-CTERM domain-containing protein